MAGAYRGSDFAVAFRIAEPAGSSPLQSVSPTRKQARGGHLHPPRATLYTAATASTPSAAVMVCCGPFDAGETRPKGRHTLFAISMLREPTRKGRFCAGVPRAPNEGWHEGRFGSKLSPRHLCPQPAERAARMSAAALKRKLRGFPAARTGRHPAGLHGPGRIRTAVSYANRRAGPAARFTALAANPGRASKIRASTSSVK